MIRDTESKKKEEEKIPIGCFIYKIIIKLLEKGKVVIQWSELKLPNGFTDFLDLNDQVIFFLYSSSFLVVCF